MSSTMERGKRNARLIAGASSLTSFRSQQRSAILGNSVQGQNMAVSTDTTVRKPLGQGKRRDISPSSRATMITSPSSLENSPTVVGDGSIDLGAALAASIARASEARSSRAWGATPFGIADSPVPIEMLSAFNMVSLV